MREKMLTRQEENILLAVYKMGGSSSLIKIKEYLQTETAREWSVSSIYVPLDRLEKQGHLLGEVGEPEARRGGRAVKNYALTPSGIQALEEVKEMHDALWKDLGKLTMKG
jgi:DNA-binding PadR family transcriptional regulator